MGDALEPRKVLVIDIGGTSVKLLASGQQEHRAFPSGPKMTPKEMVVGPSRSSPPAGTNRRDLDGLPRAGAARPAGGRALQSRQPAGSGSISPARSATRSRSSTTRRCRRSAATKVARCCFSASAPGSAPRWWSRASSSRWSSRICPTASTPTSITSAEAWLEHHGKKKWRGHVADVVKRLIAALEPDDTVIGGGNVKKLNKLPPHCRRGRQRQCVPRRISVVGGAAPSDRYSVPSDQRRLGDPAKRN